MCRWASWSHTVSRAQVKEYKSKRQFFLNPVHLKCLSHRARHDHRLPTVSRDWNEHRRLMRMQDVFVSFNSLRKQQQHMHTYSSETYNLLCKKSNILKQQHRSALKWSKVSFIMWNMIKGPKSRPQNILSEKLELQFQPACTNHTRSCWHRPTTPNHQCETTKLLRMKDSNSSLHHYFPHNVTHQYADAACDSPLKLVIAVSSWVSSLEYCAWSGRVDAW